MEQYRMKNLANTSLDAELTAERAGVRELRVRMSKKARAPRGRRQLQQGSPVEFDPSERHAGRGTGARVRGSESSMHL
jgi:hypothetical protein